MRLAPPFHDHAVLQREQPIPVWGTAGPGERVTVRLAGNLATVEAGPEGRWQVRLPPLPAGGPHELVAESRSGRASAADLLVGEVWVCSGQSNMQWQLSQCYASDGIPAGFDLPAVRLLTVGTPARLGRQEAIDGRWTVCTAATAAAFSGVGAWFGRELHRDLGVPVGLICNAWGGTRVQAWMSREALVEDPAGLDDVRHFDTIAYAPHDPEESTWASFAEWERGGAPQDQGVAAAAADWHRPGFDDAGWSLMPLPRHWQSHGHPGSGVFWFRRTLTVPASWSGRELELHLGAIDKHDDTWVNGERVGGLSWDDGANTWCTPRVYHVPARLVGADRRLVVAVRARSHVYHGGLSGPAAEMRVFPAGGAGDAMPLTGMWRYAVEQDWGVVVPPGMRLGPGNPNSPGILFDSRLAPLIPYGIRGAIWYQGESNAAEAALYRRQFPAMIRDWRRAWGQGAFPFLFVQLANHHPALDLPGSSQWAELRDAQAAALALPATGMAVAIDVGEAGDIHPKDKESVGRRLARLALAGTYGRAVAPCGPLYESMTLDAGGRARVRFRHGAGLATRDGAAPRQVAIAGSDRCWRWAETAIEAGTLVAWHPEVKRPAAVRYAWADNPEGCNLVGADGLPAAPFRSDDWPT
ncbi:MAG: 9-O-acetylesterase [Planctomycetes bacterium]|nr:9-O-acetylesterase [Planctomycetota bacterium]